MTPDFISIRGRRCDATRARCRTETDADDLVQIQRQAKALAQDSYRHLDDSHLPLESRCQSVFWFRGDHKVNMKLEDGMEDAVMAEGLCGRESRV